MAGDLSNDWTVLKLIEWTRGHFERAELDQPRLTAEVLLAHSLACKRLELYTRFDYRPSETELKAFRSLVIRAASHEPPAYLVGHKEFYSLDFRVSPNVLVPRPETEMLVTRAIERLRPARGEALLWDVCTGSGCVAVATAVNVKGLRVLATDVSEKAVEIASENAAAHGVDDRVHFLACDLFDLPGDSPIQPPFDVITANPPYVAEGDEVDETVRHEPREALYAGASGMEFIERLIAEAPERLKGGGALILEFAQGQVDAVRDAIVAVGAFAEPEILRDHQGIERSVVAVRK